MNKLRQERYNKIIGIVNSKNAVFGIYVELLGLGHSAKNGSEFCVEDEIEIVVYNPELDYAQVNFDPHHYLLKGNKDDR